MYPIKIIILLLLSLPVVEAQSPPINCFELGQLSYPVRLSGIWGYTDQNNKEYALVGTYNGVSIVDISNPSAPVEVNFINGANTIWREIKTWNNYMYVVSEQVNEGLLIVDLNTVGSPSGLSYQYNFLTVGNDTIKNSHTLFIDNSGKLFLSGSNLFNGAPIIFDLNSNPEIPQYLGRVGTYYAHDLFARNDTVWAANINDGFFSVFDIQNPSSAILLGTQQTGSAFTHNVWLSDNSEILFTTDERNGAYVEAYNVSDLSDVRLLDKWRVNNENLPVPHNVHVLNDYLITAYYTEGVTVLDAKDPSNIVQIAGFDTYPPNGTGFAGCWGVYPYFNSGLIVASDINTGLHILQPNFRRASRLRGVVTDFNSGQPLFDVRVEITGLDQLRYSMLDGTYKTGRYNSGNYSVSFRKEGYVPQVFNVNFIEDSTLILNVSLIPAAEFTISGSVNESSFPNIGVSQAGIKFEHSAGFFEKDTLADNNGFFQIKLQEEEYNVIAGNWGLMTTDTLIYVNPSTQLSIYLDSAIYDDFTFDFGWSVEGNMAYGAWERSIPGLLYAWPGMMPSSDLNNDFGKYCYISGLADSRSDSGFSILISPIFNPTEISEPHLAFNYWFTNFDSTYSITNDSLQLWIYNGFDSVLVRSFFNGLYNWSSTQIFKISEYIQITNTMRVGFRLTNSNKNNFLEAAIDKFRISDYETITSQNLHVSKEDFVSLQCFPVPFSDGFKIAYKISNYLPVKPQFIKIYNLKGQLINQYNIIDDTGELEINENWPAGIYFIQLGTKVIKTIKKN